MSANAPVSGETYMQVEGLRKTYQVRRGLFGRPKPLHAVAGVSFDVPPGTTFGLVGESGSGKSTIAKMLMLAEHPSAGTIRIGEHAVTSMKPQDQVRFRRALQPVLQDPYSSLNPRMRIGSIIDEPLRIHKVTEFGPHKERVAELLGLVGMPPETANRYAHELSGGQRQRVSIARSLALSPTCMILDEPVSALDVSIQAQILNLLKDLQSRLNLTYLLISHDLAVVAYLSSRIGVLYLGEFMEIGDVDDVIHKPRHPYTQALIASVGARSGGAAANLIQGEIPSPMNPPSGCLFNPRCPHATDRCRTEKPVLRDFGNGQMAACHYAETISIRGPGASASAPASIHPPTGNNP
jgi:oligopeptide/dipeptide ABC transporter ATP-binding protein